MILKRTTTILLLALAASVTGFAQDIGINPEKERQLMMSTKQINQFFRRFNGEELPTGERLYPADALYRNPEFRKKYFPLLFDRQASITSAALQDFANFIFDPDSARFLNLHGGAFFAEVHTTFDFQGKTESAVLIMELQEEPVGSKWVISSAFVPHFQKFYENDSNSVNEFLHPLSHEIDFMTLRKAFQHPGHMRPYLPEGFHPNQLSLLTWEVKNNRARFNTVTRVRFHCYQIPGWYFRLEQLLRSGENSGWLITRLEPVPPDATENFRKALPEP